MAEVARLNVLIEADAKRLEAELKRAQVRLAKFGASMRRVGVGLTAGITVPLALVAKASIKMAAAAEESENLFTVSMGEMADSARAFSEQISDSLGLNSFAVRETVGRFNVLFTTLGIGQRVASDMAQTLTELSADLSSFFDVSQQDAFAALQSGLVGQARPLRRFNVFLTEARLEALAYEKGIASLGEELTEAQKVQARYAAIVADTSQAQGDLLRTQDSATNTLRRISNEFDELRVKLGTAMIPAFQALLKVTEDVIDRTDSMIDSFSLLPQATQSAIIKLTLFLAALGPLALALDAMSRGAQLLLAPLQKLGVGIGKTSIGARALTAATEATGAGFAASLAGGAAIAAGSLLFLKGVMDDITRVTGEARRKFDALTDARDRLLEAPAIDPARLQRELNTINQQIAFTTSRTKELEAALQIAPPRQQRGLERNIIAFREMTNDLFRQQARFQAQLETIQSLATITVTVNAEGLSPESQLIVDNLNTALEQLDQRTRALGLAPLERLRERINLLGSAFEELQEEVEPGSAALVDLAGKYRTATTAAEALELATRNASSALKEITTIDPSTLVGILAPDSGTLAEKALRGFEANGTGFTDELTSQLELANSVIQSFEGAFRNAGRGLVLAMTDGAISIGNIFKSAVLGIVGGAVGAVFGQIGGRLAGGLFPGLFSATGPTAGASTVAGASAIAPTIIVDMSGAILFGDPAGEARKPGAQVFIREGNEAAREGGA